MFGGYRRTDSNYQSEGRLYHMNRINRVKLCRRAWTGLLLSAAIAAVAAVLYATAYHTSYDTVYRHFERSSHLIYVSGALFALSVALCAAISLSLRRRATLERRLPSPAETFSLWFSAFMFIGFGVVSAIEWSAPSGSGIGAICQTALIPLAFLSAVPFALSASDKLRGGTAHRLTSVFPVLWCCALMFSYYFDLSEMPLNDPELILTICSLSSLIIFLLSECRRALGIITPPIALFSSAVAVSIAGTTSLARVVLFCTDNLAYPGVMELVMFFVLSLTALARALALPESLDAVEVPDETAQY